MGRPSDGGGATRSKTDDGVGAGAADRAGTLATKSVDEVGISGVTMAYTLSSETSHVTPGPPLSAEGEPANLIDASSPVQLYRTA